MRPVPTRDHPQNSSIRRREQSLHRGHQQRKINAANAGSSGSGADRLPFHLQLESLVGADGYLPESRKTATSAPDRRAFTTFMQYIRTQVS
jgi:hypothetical protein